MGGSERFFLLYSIDFHPNEPYIHWQFIVMIVSRFAWPFACRMKKGGLAREIVIIRGVTKPFSSTKYNMTPSIKDLFYELRQRQEAIIQERKNNIRKLERDEQLREELKRLIIIEDHLFDVLRETFDVLDKKGFELDKILSEDGFFTERRRRTLEPGSMIQTKYKGKNYRARVNDSGKIVYNGDVFPSIAALSVEITGKTKSHLRSRKFWTINRRPELTPVESLKK